MKFKLLDFIKGDVTKDCLVSGEVQGHYRTSIYTFKPGQVYETNDPIFAAYISFDGIGDVRTRSPYSQELKETLERLHVPYESRRCSTCAGSKPSLYYNPFVIVNDNEDANDETA